MRVYQHVIDTMSIKTTLNSIPHHWVVRDLSERDYGIDMMIEIFKEDGKDSKGHEMFKPTGAVCNLQLKGTNDKLVPNKHGDITYSIDRNSLLYIEKFATPFFLVRVCVLAGQEKVYFLWLQRYIMEVLDVENPNWRTKKRRNKENKLVFQDSYTIRIPPSNELSKKTEKIERIAARIKYIEEHAEFYERLTPILPLLPNLSEKGLNAKEYVHMRTELKRILNFDVLLAYNNVMIDKSAVQDIINYVDSCEQGSQFIKTDDDEFPHQFNLDLLYNENALRIGIEKLVAENDQNTVY